MTKTTITVAVLSCIVLLSIPAVAPTAAHTADYNIIRGDRNHNWTTDVGHAHTPPCTDARPCTGDLRGTNANDKIIGGAGWDWMGGGRGADWIIGNGWMDQAYGGASNDRIELGSGHDHAWGDGGNDTIDISDGVDEKDHTEEIHGGDGYDICTLDNAPGDTVVDCEKVIRKPLNGN